MKRFLLTALLVGAVSFSAAAADEIKIQLAKKATVAFCMPEGESTDLLVRNYTLKGKKWKQKGADVAINLPASSENAVPVLVDTMSLVQLGADNCVLFSYLNTYSDNKEYDLVWALYNTSTGSFSTVVFTGKDISDGTSIKLEGISDLAMATDPHEAATVYLGSIVSNDERLVELAEGVYLTDKSIDWWLSENPSASKKSKIKMGGLDGKSSLVESFNSQKKEKTAKFSAAVFDERGYTVVVYKSAQTGDCSLAWVEKSCTTKNNTRYLYNYYFEDANTLALVFVESKKMIKYHLNLATHTLQITK